LIVRNKVHGLNAIFRFDNPIAIIINRLVLGSDVIIYKMNGNSYLVDHRGDDTNGLRACLTTGMYRDLLATLPVQPNWNVIDIGANTGGFIALLVSMGMRIQSVIAVELNPVVYARLSFNIKFNHTFPARIVNAGISAQPGVLSKKFARGDTGEGLHQTGKISYTPNEISETSVPLMTVDQLLLDSADNGLIFDLCKIDIEGEELNILRAKTWFQLSRVKYLIMEIHSNDPGEVALAIDQLGRIGFKTMLKSSTENVWLFGNGAHVAN
jgi:FkbM family methyltransferase